MFGNIEWGGGSKGKKKRPGRDIPEERSLSQHKSSKRERSDKGDFSSRNSNRSKKRRFPSEEALQLSDRLKKLSREKKLDEALAVFWDSSNKTIRDGHHACIMVDMAARCGKIAVSHYVFVEDSRSYHQLIFVVLWACSMVGTRNSTS